MSEPTLTEFILARIAEDEQVARDLADWTKWEVPIFRLFDDDPESQADLDAKDYAKVFAQLMRAHEVPARVLAECAAVRKIIELFEEERARADIYNRGYDDGLLTTNNDLRSRLASNARCQGLKESLLALATIWADHDDYREEWA